MIRTFLRMVPLILFSIVAVPVQMLALALGLKARRQLPVIWHRLACVALGLRVKVIGDMHHGRPLLLTANHVSWIDIVALSSLAPLSFVAKSEVGRWPVFGFLADLQRTIYVERQSRARTGRTLGEMADRMRAGDPVLLFAEGTSTDGSDVLPFHSALIGAARQAVVGEGGTVHIQPVAIAYTRLNGLPIGRIERPLIGWIGDTDLLPHLWRVLRIGAVDVTIAFLPPLLFDAATDRKSVSRQLQTRVRDAVLTLVNGRDLTL